jgi:hypothetical protein
MRFLSRGGVCNKFDGAGNAQTSPGDDTRSESGAAVSEFLMSKLVGALEAWISRAIAIDQHPQHGAFKLLEIRVSPNVCHHPGETSLRQ